MFTQSNYAGVINNTLNGTVTICGTLNASNVIVNNEFMCNGGIILTSTCAPANYNFIGFTGTVKITNSIVLAAGYNLLLIFSTPLVRTYSFKAQLRLEWRVGQVQ